MKNVHRMTGRDGKVRLYLRRAGCPRVPLKSPDGSPELEAEVAALIKALEQPKAVAGTMTAQLRAYELDSADYLGLAASTKVLYGRILGEMADDLGPLHVKTFTPAFVLRLRDLWAQRGYRAANLRLQILKNVLKPALISGELEVDPFARIDQVRRPHDLEEPHLIWPDQDFATVLAAAKPGLARGLAVARWIGPRRDDVVKVTAANRRQGQFVYLAGKRKVPVDVPEPPELTAALERLPRSPKTLTLAYNEEGLPYTGNGFYQVVTDLVTRLHAKGKISTAGLDVHGLRHTRGVELALAGLTDAEGAAMLGHRSPHSFATYRRQADRIRLARNGADKLARLQEHRVNAELDNRVDKTCITGSGEG